MTLGSWLRAETARQALTQVQLADAAGLSRGYIGGLTRDIQLPSDEAIWRLSVALGVDQAPLYALRAADLAAQPVTAHRQVRRRAATHGTRPTQRPEPRRASTGLQDVSPRELAAGIVRLVVEDTLERVGITDERRPRGH